MNAKIPVGLLAFFLLAVFVGVIIGREVHTVDLPGCQNRLLAAELTQEGMFILIDECMDLHETLEVCEIGQRAADGIMDDFERNETILRAQVIVIKSRCPPKSDSSKSGEP